eukprot:TRINITY_DN1569_c0_g1_i3.p1 TRINITY_DN1569_c0_g1~~TRINITY_DN1569_c0_g1_i3.p1  ORF type:complete len:358 (-),score=22.21 TRINITY_DN1569_c0_g1_i3:13-1011(-)
MSFAKVKTTGRAPKLRGGHAATFLSQRIGDRESRFLLIFGGSTRSAEFYNDSYLLNLDKWSWSKVECENVPACRAGHSLVSRAGSAFLFGGQQVTLDQHQDMHSQFFDDLWRFDLESKRWEPLESKGDKPSGRNAHTASRVDNTMYIVGGSTSDGPCNDVYSLDLDTLEWQRVQPANAMAELKSEEGEDDLEVPVGREMHTAVVMNSSLMVLGGRSFDSICDQFYEFNTETRMWQLHDKCFAVCGHACVVYGSRLIIFGGTDGLTFFDTPKAFNPELLIWTDAELKGPRPPPRFAHTLTQISPTESILFGGSNQQQDLNDLHILRDGAALQH